MAEESIPRRVAVGSDMRHDSTDAVVAHLEAQGALVVRCGAVAGPEVPWPDVAEQVARLVAQGAVDTGVLCCWTGTGVSIAANKVPGIRAALCNDPQTAALAREWNDANVLAMSLRNTAIPVAKAMLEAWFSTKPTDDPKYRAMIAET